jgi:hypothetical protein
VCKRERGEREVQKRERQTDRFIKEGLKQRGESKVQKRKNERYRLQMKGKRKKILLGKMMKDRK